MSTESFESKVASNEWETNFDEVVAFIKWASREDSFDWSWCRNTTCKYVDLRIDMRDGAFLILDRNGKRISFDQLKFQYGQVKP